jgi:hypothetical protein
MNKKEGLVISELLTKQQAVALIKACLSEVGTTSHKRNESDRKRNRNERWR